MDTDSSQLPPRHAMARAWQFHRLAVLCEPDRRDDFEAFVEASIVFARAACDRLRTQYSRSPGWHEAWTRMRCDASFRFIDQERNWLLKQAPPKIGQVIRVGRQLVTAAESYYYEQPDIPATVTLERHLAALESLIRETDAAMMPQA